MERRGTEGRREAVVVVLRNNEEKIISEEGDAGTVLVKEEVMEVR